MPWPITRGFSLRCVKPDGQEFPVVAHEGIFIVVMEPKDEFEILVTRGSANDGCSSTVMADLRIDTKAVGYMHMLHRGSSRKFDGWLVAGHYDLNTPLQKQRFVCGSCYSPDAAVADGGSNAQPQVGRIQLQLFNARSAGQPVEGSQAGGTPSTEATRAPEGKKWFTLPGLKTGAGETFKGGCFAAERFDRVGPAVAMLEVRYDSMDNLLLRKVLDPARADHRQLMAGARSATVRSLVASSSIAAGQKRRVADAASGAGPEGGVRVKRERGAGPAAPAFVDMCKEEPRPMKINGRVLQQDEVATCDLTAEEEELQWQVTKKEVVQL